MRRKRRNRMLAFGVAVGLLFTSCGIDNSDEMVSNKWYEKYHIIAHSGGGISGYTYANCLEGWKAAYDRGVRVYDADVNETRDGVPVLRHEWTDNLETTDVAMNDSEISIDINGVHHKIEEKIPSYEEFMREKVYSKYTPMDLDSVISFMMEHADVFVSVDTKTSEALKKVVDYFCATDHEELLKRVITNTYTFDGYFEIMNIYPFENVVMRQHYWCLNDWQEMADFCTEHGIPVVNVSASLYGDEGIQVLKQENLYVYYAVIDYISDMNVMKNSGGDGIVSNWLSEEDWTNAKETK